MIKNWPFRVFNFFALSAFFIFFLVLPAKSWVPQISLENEINQLKQNLALLNQKIAVLVSKEVPDNLLVEAQIYAKALEWLLLHGDHQQKGIFKKAEEITSHALIRVNQLAAGQTPWMNETEKPIARAYRSKVDGSIQPYSITLPESYGKGNKKKYPLHIVLHGRNDKLSETGFLHDNAGIRRKPGQNFIELQVYGRGNNAYRWAGEADLFEALDNFLFQENQQGRGELPDKSKIVLRGFSMGGAGTWHLGLHYPDRWCVIGPGAGFTTTHGYVPKLPEKLPPHQEDCLTIYDAYRYAQNASMVPVVAYSGELDKQKQAADVMEKNIRALGISMDHLIAPGLEHKFPPEWLEKAQKLYGPHIENGINNYPEKIRFSTFTLKYSSCHWIKLLALNKHYTAATVDAKLSKNQFFIQTSNIQALAITLPPGSNPNTLLLNIDDQIVKGLPAGSKKDTQWHVRKNTKSMWEIFSSTENVKEEENNSWKEPGLQGPIDDAFTSGFVCVRGTGSPWNKEIEDAATRELAEFKNNWELFFRGKLPIKTDKEITPGDIKEKNLILFGDPGSNSLLAKLMPQMPFSWTKDNLKWRNKNHSAKDHIPVIIYPNPLSPKRYVVFNSGHTFKEADFRGTNALLFPRLGDFALIKVGSNANKSPIDAGIFMENWQFSKP